MAVLTHTIVFDFDDTTTSISWNKLMLVFGHAGITLGAAVLITGAISKSHTFTTKAGKASKNVHSTSQLVPAQHHSSAYRASWLTSLARYMDIRFLLIGSLLPDIVDKPLGLYFLRDTFSNGRIFCHTLLFLILLSLMGLYLYKSRTNIWVLALSFGTLTHLILDRMWLAPRTLLWPLYGFAFEPEDLSDWTMDMLRALTTDSGVYLPELAGAVVLIWFFSVLVRQRTIYPFIKSGKVS